MVIFYFFQTFHHGTSSHSNKITNECDEIEENKYRIEFRRKNPVRINCLFWFQWLSQNLRLLSSVIYMQFFAFHCFAYHRASFSVRWRREGKTSWAFDFFPRAQFTSSFCSIFFTSKTSKITKISSILHFLAQHICKWNDKPAWFFSRIINSDCDNHCFYLLINLFFGSAILIHHYAACTETNECLEKY